MEYLSLNEYLRKKFGHKLYKLSISGAVTCPNRDGTVGTGGCIFCSGTGSGEFAQDAGLFVTEQIEKAKLLVAKKFRGGKYIAYFQNFTNTYIPYERMEKMFTEAVLHPDVEVLSVATRPDCLPEDVIALLRRLNAVKPVWVELGLQTVHQKTADLINRCYPLETYDSAVKRLHAAGIEVITHVILGLPHESEEEILQTVRYVGRVTDGIKLQLLHVLKGTRLEQMYLNGEFETLSFEQYLTLLRKCIEVLPKNVVVHRLTGDADKKLLVAPMWSADKKRVLNAIARLFMLKYPIGYAFL